MTVYDPPPVREPILARDPITGKTSDRLSPPWEIWFTAILPRVLSDVTANADIYLAPASLDKSEDTFDFLYLVSIIGGLMKRIEALERLAFLGD